MKSKVYFTRDLTPEGVVRVYNMLGAELGGMVAVKLHSGEKGNQNFIGPEFWRPVIGLVGGTVVECNTAYDGERNVTDRHKRLMEYHGWTKYFDVDILDAEGPDKVLDIPMGKVIKKNYLTIEGKKVEGKKDWISPLTGKKYTIDPSVRVYVRVGRGFKQYIAEKKMPDRLCRFVSGGVELGLKVQEKSS